MRLEEFSNNNLTKVISQLSECAKETGAIASYSIINESTGITTTEQYIVETNLKDLYDKGQELLLKPLQQGAIKADELKDAIVSKLGKEKSNAIMQKVKKYGKPALMFLMIGGALIGGIPDAMASTGDQLLNGIANSMHEVMQAQGLGQQEFQTAMEQLSNVQVDGIPVQEYAAKVEQVAAKQDNFHQSNVVIEQGTKNIYNAFKDSMTTSNDTSQTGTFSEPGSRVNVSDEAELAIKKGFLNALKLMKQGQ